MWIGIFDKTNAKSVYMRSPQSLRKAMDDIPDHVRAMDEDELLMHTNPSKALCAERMKFWELVERDDKRIQINEVFKHRTTFYNMVKDPYKTMWFLTAPSDFLSTQKSILERSLTMLHKFISGDTMWVETTTVKRFKDGSEKRETRKEINVKAVEQARKIMESMTDRIHGAVAMNLRIQGQHVHAAVSPEARLLTLGHDEIMHIGADEPPVVVDPDAPKPRLDKMYVEAWGDGTEKATKEADPEDFIADFMDDDDSSEI